MSRVCSVRSELLLGIAADVGAGIRPADDFYQTPVWLVRAVLAKLDDKVATGICYVLDAGAGTGVLAHQAEAWLRAKGQLPHVTAVEQSAACVSLYPGHWRTREGDWFAWAQDARVKGIFDLVISNPSFCVWDAWVDTCFPLLAPGGFLLVLGHTGFLGGQSRAAWWRAHRPRCIYVSPRRPNYRGQGTDSRDAMWVQWGPGEVPGTSEIKWLKV